MPSATNAVSTARAKAPSCPQSMVTKFVADGRAVSPWAAAMRPIAARDVADVVDPCAVLQGGQRAGLRHPAHAEMVAHLLKARDHICCPDGVTHPRPGHAMSFGKGAQADHIGRIRRDIGGGAMGARSI